MPKHGKRYTTAVAEFDRGAPVALAEAVTRVKQNATAKFDETVELHIRTGLDPRHADQQVRGTTNLPHGLGKTIRVAVFAEGEAARDAEEAGAAIVGADDLISKVQDGFTDFDVALAQRELMGKVGRLGRILGPRGLMPNPRAGTVVGGSDIGRGGRGSAGGPGRVPPRPSGDHARAGRQGQLRGSAIGRQHLRARQRRRQGQAQRREGQLYPRAASHLYHGTQRETGVAEHDQQNRGVDLRSRRRRPLAASRSP